MKKSHDVLVATGSALVTIVLVVGAYAAGIVVASPLARASFSVQTPSATFATRWKLLSRRGCVPCDFGSCNCVVISK